MLCAVIAVKGSMMKETYIKTYSELITLPTYRERFNYLKLNGSIGIETFGMDRQVNQALYHSGEWARTRRDIIVRDSGNDMGVEGYEVYGQIIVHHINPITVDDILNRRACVLDPENLISVATRTHKAIHYSDDSILVIEPTIRRPNDCCPWRK